MNEITDHREFQIDTSGISPTEFKILVRTDPVEEKTAGGIYIPETSLERQQAAAVTGKLIAVSPLAFTYHDEWAEGSKPKPGDRVVFAKYSGMTIKGRDGVEYKLLSDKDIAAVLAF